MKKALSVFVFLGLMSPFFNIQTSSANADDYWKYQKTISSKYSNLYLRIKKLKEKAEAARSQNTAPTYPKTTTQNQENLQQKIQTNRRVFPVKTITQKDTQSTLRLSITRIPITKPISEITDQSIPVFSLGFAHTGPVNRTDFKPAINVNKVAFRLIDNTGAVANPSDFSLVVAGEDFNFERDGKVVINFNNFRLANGESKALDVAVKVENPDIFPRINGSFRVRVDSASASVESSYKNIPVSLYGPSISNFVTLYPRSGTTGTPILASTPEIISSRTLSAGEKATVLGIKLGASYDDMILKKITVRNLHGNSIDSWVNRINLINYNTGQTVGSTRFINGEANFNLTNNKIQINRNSRVHLGFQVELSSTLNTGTNTQFQLSLNSSDIEVWGIGSGREVPNSQKVVNFDSQPFFVTQNGGSGGIYHSSNQPQLVATGRLNNIYQFEIKNNGSREFSIGRITMNVTPNGLNFAGGGSSDFALYESVNGHETRRSNFTTNFLGGNTVQFDTQSEIYISPRSTREFALRVALDNTNASNKSVTIKILGDSTLKVGTLPSVRSSGANFIWSDHSGRPHVSGSTDWLSGYLFPGLPTDAYRNQW